MASQRNRKVQVLCIISHFTTNLAAVALYLLLFVQAVEAQVPVPLINLPLLPDAAVPGATDFVLTVNGTGFVPGSVVNWNRKARATTFVSNSQLTATIPATDIGSAGTAWVTVVNPGLGGLTSNVVFFAITKGVGDSVSFASPSSLFAGTDPNSVVTGDFNGDGNLDLAGKFKYSEKFSGGETSRAIESLRAARDGCCN